MQNQHQTGLIFFHSEMLISKISKELLHWELNWTESTPNIPSLIQQCWSYNDFFFINSHKKMFTYSRLSVQYVKNFNVVIFSDTENDKCQAVHSGNACWTTWSCPFQWPWPYLKVTAMSIFDRHFCVFIRLSSNFVWLIMLSRSWI